jgi:hypothetical protein
MQALPANHPKRAVLQSHLLQLPKVRVRVSA